MVTQTNENYPHGALVSISNRSVERKTWRIFWDAGNCHDLFTGALLINPNHSIYNWSWITLNISRPLIKFSTQILCTNSRRISVTFDHYNSDFYAITAGVSQSFALNYSEVKKCFLSFITRFIHSSEPFPHNGTGP